MNCGPMKNHPGSTYPKPGSVPTLTEHENSGWDDADPRNGGVTCAKTWLDNRLVVKSSAGWVGMTESLHTRPLDFST